MGNGRRGLRVGILLRRSMWVFSGLGYTVWGNKMKTEYKRICIYHIVIRCGVIECVG